MMAMLTFGTGGSSGIANGSSAICTGAADMVVSPAINERVPEAAR
jgi:hypothetical protein